LIPMYDLHNLSTYETNRLEAERDEAILGIGAIKQKLLRLPQTHKEARQSLLAAKLAYGSVHQITSSELGRRRREARLERLRVVEAAFVTLAKERLPDDVFQDLLDEAVEKTRE